MDDVILLDVIQKTDYINPSIDNQPSLSLFPLSTLPPKLQLRTHHNFALTTTSNLFQPTKLSSTIMSDTGRKDFSTSM